MLSSCHQIYTLLYLTLTLPNVTLRDFLIDFHKEYQTLSCSRKLSLSSLSSRKTSRNKYDTVNLMGENSSYYKVTPTEASSPWQHHTSPSLLPKTLKQA